MRWKGILTIRTSLLLCSTALILVPVVAINTVWLQSQRHSLRDDASKRLAMQASFAAQTIDATMKEKLAKLAYYADSDGDASHTAEQLNEEFAELLEADPEIVQIVLAERGGDVTSSAVGESLGGFAVVSTANVFDEPAFKEITFGNQERYIGAPRYDEAGRSLTRVALPVGKSGPNDTVARAVLIGVVQMDTIWQASLINKHNTSQVSYAVSQSGELLGHLDARFKAQPASFAVLPAPQAIQEAKGKTDFSRDGITGTSELQTDVLASVRILPYTGWGVVAQEPLQTIDSRATMIARWVIIADAAVLVLAVALGIILSRYITSPLRSLAKSAQMMGELRFDAPLPVERRDELGVVARSFQAMGQQLKASLGRVSAERNQFDVVINSIKDGILVLDESGTVRLANRACGEMLGVDEVLLKSQPYKELFSLYLGDHDFEIKLNQTGTELHTDVTLKTRFKTYTVDLQITHLNIHSERIAAIVTITDRSKEQELETMKLDFVSIAAHELRTPITSVRGFIELLLNEFKGSYTPEVHTILRMMSSGSQQLINLVNNLLTVSKIERDRFSIFVEKANWTELVMQVIDGHMYGASQQAVQLQFDGPETPIDVAIDPVSMHEVLDNLIGNALQHAPRNSVVTIRVRQSPDGIVTSVSDHGPGIPEEDQHKLFTKFYRVNGPLSSGSGGTGLGLYLSKSIVEMHKGKIWVESTLGAGSVFSFILPPFDEKFIRQNQAMSMYNEDTSLRKKRGWVTKDITR